MYPIRDRLLAFALTLAAASPVAAENLYDMTSALHAAAKRDWAGAAQAATASGPIAESLVAWQQLRAGQGSWAEYRDFAAKHGNWPGLDLFYKRGDALLRPDLPRAEILAWFGQRRPDTWNGERAYLTALQASDPEAMQAELVRFWTMQALPAPDQNAMLAAYGDRLKGHHDARLTSLLDQGEWQAAETMLPLVTPDAAKLGAARIATQATRPGVDKLILALPPLLQLDEGLALDRFRWRARSKMTDLARQLMLERSTSAEALRDPTAWSPLRADYARAAIRAGDWALAERLAANHFLPQGHKDYVDLEWLAGYAALRGGATDRALAHFQHLETQGASPITVSRALYWQGRAFEVVGDKAKADAAYARAAVHQTAYYGQLAAEKLGLPMQADLAIPGRADATLPDWRGAKLTEDLRWQAAVWLFASGYPEQGQRFLMQIAETAEPDDIARMARLTLELRQPWHAVRLAKAAAAKGAIYPAAYFPLTGLENDGHGTVPTELVMSIARRESEFNYGVTSHAGAKGLMQVMPDTARMMANRLGEAYHLDRLTTDAAYNARLGAAYLQGLEERFGYSVALIAAGYNAGPGRSAKWLDQFGDLRRNVDPVDWVEMIPFDETRNYVMRVAEALPIYRARIMGKPAPIVPTFDLTGGGLMPAPPQPPITLAFSAHPPRSLRSALAAASGGVLADVVVEPTVMIEASAGIVPLVGSPAPSATR